MKKTTLILILMMTLNPAIYAYDVSKKYKEHKDTQSAPTQLENLQEKIDSFNKYLKELPIEIQKTIGMLKDKKADGNKAEAMVIRLVSTLDKCATQELDEKSEEMCKMLSNESVGSIIKDKQNKIRNAIAFIQSKLKELKRKDDNKAIIQEGIISLENARDILLGTL